MDLNRKLEVMAMAVASISRHADEDVAVRAAALDRVDAMVVAARAEMKAEVDARIAESLPPAAEA